MTSESDADSDSQKDFLPNGKIAPLLASEIIRDQSAAGAAEIINAVGYVLPHIDLAVRIGNFVDHFHLR